MFDISLVGTGGMIPLSNRFLTAMAVRYNGSMLLIDCGEGTQVTLRELGWGFVNIDYILFTHFHADHIAGLPGLMLSLSNYGRTDMLTIAGPKGVKHVVESLKVIAPELSYSINYIEISFEDSNLKNIVLGEFHISALRLRHRIECIGYSIELYRKGKFDVARAKEHQIPVEYWNKLQKGQNVEFGGNIYSPDMVLGPDRKGLKVSYITDTRPIEEIPDFVRGSDLFICEGLYGDEEMREKAYGFHHMIYSDAARFAKEGNVKELWLTHYSQAMTNPFEHLYNATDIFQNTKAGEDRMTKTLSFEE